MDSGQKIKKSLALKKVEEIPLYENFISLDIASKLVPDVISPEHISALGSDEAPDKKNKRKLHLLKKGLRKELEVAQKAGLDAISIAIHPEVEWTSSHELKTEFGRYYRPNLNLLGYGAIDMLSQRKEGPDTWYKSEVDAIEDFLELNLTPGDSDRVKMFKGFTNSEVMPIPELLMFQRIWSILGYGKFIDLFTQNKALVKDLLEKWKKYNFEAIDTLREMGYDVFFYGGDFGCTTGGLIPIKEFKEFLLPYLEKIVNKCHQQGSQIILHSCGDVNEYFPHLVKAGFNGFHPIEPPWMNFESLKKAWGDQICLIGNVDSRISLVEASKEEVKQETKRIIQVGQLKGHILSSSHSIHPGVKYENWRAMLEAAHNYGTRRWVDNHPPQGLPEWNQPTFNRDVGSWEEVKTRREQGLLQPVDVYLESKNYHDLNNKHKKIGIGTVATPHEAGREIVSSCLKAEGYEVKDEGCVTPENCIEKLADYDVVLLSMVKNPQAIDQGKVIARKLNQASSEIKIIVGGGAVNRLLVEMEENRSRRGAVSQLYKMLKIDGFGAHEIEATKQVKELCL